MMAVVIIGVLCVVGAVVLSKQASKSNAQKKAQVAASNLTQSFTDTLGGFTIKYPSDWTKNNTENNSDPDHPISRTTFTSLDGSVFHVGANFDTPADHCLPAKGDKPFRVGNKCDSFEYLSSENLPVSNAYVRHTTIKNGITKTSMDKTDARMITAHHGSPSGVESYFIGVTDLNFIGVTDLGPGYQLKLNNPQMGVYGQYTHFTVYNHAGKLCPYVYMYAGGESVDFLSSKDAATIKDMIRSVTIDPNNKNCKTDPASS